MEWLLQDTNCDIVHIWRFFLSVAVVNIPCLFLMSTGGISPHGFICLSFHWVVCWPWNGSLLYQGPLCSLLCQYVGYCSCVLILAQWYHNLPLLVGDVGKGYLQHEMLGCFCVSVRRFTIGSCCGVMANFNPLAWSSFFSLVWSICDSSSHICSLFHVVWNDVSFPAM